MTFKKRTRPSSSRQKQASRYARCGWSVVPMHAIKGGMCSCPKGDACERAGKHPSTQHGVNDATTERDQIKHWWTASPNANVGIATGRKSGIICWISTRETAAA